MYKDTHTLLILAHIHTHPEAQTQIHVLTVQDTPQRHVTYTHITRNTQTHTNVCMHTSRDPGAHIQHPKRVLGGGRFRGGQEREFTELGKDGSSSKLPSRFCYFFFPTNPTKAHQQLGKSFPWSNVCCQLSSQSQEER